MVEQTLILIPGNAYEDMTKLEAGRRYMEMAHTGYNNLMKFGPEYELKKDDEDYYKSIVGGPVNSFDLFVFYKQPIIGN